MKTHTKPKKQTRKKDPDHFDINAPIPHSDGPYLLRSYFNNPGPTIEPVDTGVRLPNDGLTPEQRRMRFLSNCDSYRLESTASQEIEFAAGKVRMLIGEPSNVATLARTQPRDTTSGVYVPTIEQFTQRVAALPNGTPDDNAARILIQDQPWRKACALTEDKQSQPVPTYGPMLLPESRCPVAALENPPAPEVRPTHWQPGANPSDILMGIVHDLANCTSALSARLAVSLGHQPDTEAVNSLRALTRSAKAIQNILHAEEDRRDERSGEAAPTKRRHSPGRPRKRTLLDPEKAITLRLEIIEKNKKFRNKKYCNVTLEESVSEAEINSQTPKSPDNQITPRITTPEAEINSGLKPSARSNSNQTAPGGVDTPAHNSCTATAPGGVDTPVRSTCTQTVPTSAPPALTATAPAACS